MVGAHCRLGLGVCVSLCYSEQHQKCRLGSGLILACIEEKRQGWGRRKAENGQSCDGFEQKSAHIGKPNVRKWKTAHEVVANASWIHVARGLQRSQPSQPPAAPHRARFTGPGGCSASTPCSMGPAGPPSPPKPHVEGMSLCPSYLQWEPSPRALLLSPLCATSFPAGNHWEKQGRVWGPQNWTKMSRHQLLLIHSMGTNGKGLGSPNCGGNKAAINFCYRLVEGLFHRVIIFL